MVCTHGNTVCIILLDDLIANKKASGRTKDLFDVEVLEGCRKMTKTFRALRMEDERDDNSWALALGDSERMEIATRLVSDLWSVAHNGSPFPRMDRTVYSYIPAPAKNTKI